MYSLKMDPLVPLILDSENIRTIVLKSRLRLVIPSIAPFCFLISCAGWVYQLELAAWMMLNLGYPKGQGFLFIVWDGM